MVSPPFILLLQTGVNVDVIKLDNAVLFQLYHKLGRACSIQQGLYLMRDKPSPCIDALEVDLKSTSMFFLWHYFFTFTINSRQKSRNSYHYFNLALYRSPHKSALQLDCNKIPFFFFTITGLWLSFSSNGLNRQPGSESCWGEREHPLAAAERINVSAAASQRETAR